MSRNTKMPVILDLHYVDELISVRRQQHGGFRGAPNIINGYREGESLNRSCIVMLSALMQGYIEEVFVECSKRLIPSLRTSLGLASHRQSFAGWGNPNARNVIRLFRRLGIEDVLAGLNWQKCIDKTVKEKMDALNEIRNDIAHGNRELRVNNVEISLSLQMVRNYRNFCEAFAARFENHALTKL